MKLFLVTFIVAFIAVLYSWNRAKNMSALEVIAKRNLGVNLAGKRAVVVGGTSGIGMGIALRLAKANVSVTIVGRNKQRGTEIVEEMKGKSTDAKSKFDFIDCDAQLLGNVKSCVDQFVAKQEPIDYLVLTQGIATTQGRTPTTEGLDQKLAIHYFGRVAFMKLMAPLMENSVDPRVLTVLSAGVHKAYDEYATDPELINNYSLGGAANSAGMYNDIAVDSMSREHPKISYIHAAPGMVNTNWGTELPWYLKPLARGFLSLAGVSIEDCGEKMSDAIFNPKYKAPGFHLLSQNAEPVNTVGKVHDVARESVWESTKSVLKRILG